LVAVVEELPVGLVTRQPVLVEQVVVAELIESGASHALNSSHVSL